MTIRIRVGGALKTVKRRRIMVAGVLRTIARTRVMVGDELKTIYVAMTVNVSPSSASGSGSANPIVSGQFDVTPDGGTGPYTYTWSRKSGSTLISVQSGPVFLDHRFFYFQSNFLAPGETASVVFTVTVTDKNGLFAEADVSGTLTRT